MFAYNNNYNILFYFIIILLNCFSVDYSGTNISEDGPMKKINCVLNFDRELSKFIIQMSVYH